MNHILISPPRSRASLLGRLMGGAVPADEEFTAMRALAAMREGDAWKSAALSGAAALGVPVLRSLGRQSAAAADDWWGWLLDSFPEHRLVFLRRPQDEVEMSMLVTAEEWIPKWGTCTGCCGRQVRVMHDAMERFLKARPERVSIIESGDLLAYDTAAAALASAGVSLERDAWEREIAVVTHPRADWRKDDGGPVTDPFDPRATIETLNALPRGDFPDPFAEGAGIEVLALLPGADKPEPLPDEEPLRLPVPRSDRGLRADELVVYTLRWGEADWMGYCVRSLEDWTGRHGYELRVRGEPDADEGLPDEKFATVAMMREFLEGEHEWMLFVDADVAIHPQTPRWPRVRGMAAAHDKPMSMRHWGRWLGRFYPALPAGGWVYRNSGVWSVDRAAAEMFLREVDASPVWRSGVREQHQWNAWMIFAAHRGMKVPVLADDWNQLVKYRKSAAWFHHLAGRSDVKMGYLEKCWSGGFLPRPPRPFEVHEPRSARAIVYYWLPALAEWDELRFSLRSVHRYFSDHDCPIYILGHTPPEWLVPGGRVEFIRMEGYEVDRDPGLFQARVLAAQIAREVLVWNDDIYLLRDQGWEDFDTALTEGTLHQKERALLEHGNGWRKGMGQAVNQLRHAGMKRVRRFATHTPVRYEVDKAREILSRYHVPYKGGFANLYHNHHRSPWRPVGGDKCLSFPCPPEARFYNHYGEMPEDARAELLRMFPEPAPWEDAAVPVVSGAPKVRMCVATHGEDLDWLDKVPKGIRVCVYDATGKRDEYRSVPNEGREAGQYIRHMLRFWGDFAEYELFVQGNPFEHAPDFLEMLEARGWEGLDMFRFGRPGNPDSVYNELRCADLIGRLGLPYDSRHYWSFGAMFAVRGEVIRARGREWWERLLGEVLADSVSPWCVERQWDVILGAGLPAGEGVS